MADHENILKLKIELGKQDIIKEQLKERHLQAEAFGDDAVANKAAADCGTQAGVASALNSAKRHLNIQDSVKIYAEQNAKHQMMTVRTEM